MAKKKRDELSEAEMTKATARQSYYEPGRPYLWTLTQGWAVVGFYVCHDTPLFIRVEHCNHFRNAGVDYGRLGQEGPGASCEWRYEGLDQVNLNHVIKVQEYHAEVPRGRVRV